MPAFLLFAPIVPLHAQEGDQAILSRITQIIKKVEALGMEQQELRTRQEQAIEKIKSLKVWSSKFR